MALDTKQLSDLLRSLLPGRVDEAEVKKTLAEYGEQQRKARELLEQQRQSTLAELQQRAQMEIMRNRSVREEDLRRMLQDQSAQQIGGLTNDNQMRALEKAMRQGALNPDQLAQMADYYRQQRAQQQAADDAVRRQLMEDQRRQVFINGPFEISRQAIEESRYKADLRYTAADFDSAFARQTSTLMQFFTARTMDLVQQFERAFPKMANPEPDGLFDYRDRADLINQGSDQVNVADSGRTALMCVMILKILIVFGVRKDVATEILAFIANRIGKAMIENPPAVTIAKPRKINLED